MCKEFKKALEVVEQKIRENKDFSFDELQNDIINKGGVLRVSPGHTVGEYISELEEEGILSFNKKTKRFQIES
jgi:hypothetical protein